MGRRVSALHRHSETPDLFFPCRSQHTTAHRSNLARFWKRRKVLYIFLKMESPSGQAGLKLLTSSDLLVSASQIARTTGVSHRPVVLYGSRLRAGSQIWKGLNEC